MTNMYNSMQITAGPLSENMIRRKDVGFSQELFLEPSIFAVSQMKSKCFALEVEISRNK